MKARQNQQQGQCKGRGRQQTEKISKGRQQTVRVVKTVQVINRETHLGKKLGMSDGAKQDLVVSARKCAAYMCV